MTAWMFALTAMLLFATATLLENRTQQKDSIQGYGASVLMVHTANGTFLANSSDGKAAMDIQKAKWAAEDAAYIEGMK
jgi:hypothetical protein